VEISYFLEDVDKLRADADRLNARVERLLNSVDGSKP
jgi:ubiquinone biosynthesis protein UbiJ